MLSHMNQRAEAASTRGFAIRFDNAIMMRKPIDGEREGLYIAHPFVFQSSSMVEHAAVNRDVEGSSPSSGAIFKFFVMKNF